MRTRLRRTSAKLQICLAGRVLRAADNLRLWVAEKKQDD
jgi:hypothetical protein